MEQKDIQKRKEQQHTAICVIYICVIVCLSCGLGYGTLSVIYPAIKGYNAVHNWSKQNCTIIKTDVTTHKTTDRSGRGYLINIIYSYNYNGKDYSSTQYDFQDIFFKQFYPTHKTANSIIAKYMVNGIYSCYVNPQNPSQAVLSTTLYKPLKKVIVSAGLIFFGAMLAFFGIREKNRMRTFEECLPLNKTLPKIYSSTPVRLGYFMGYLVTALGFVLIAYLIADEKTDKMGYVIILAILGTPAIVCLCLALNRLYKVFLTPVHITFHSTNLRIGETLRIDLKIGGKTENISALMLEINCQAAIIDENTKKSVDKTLYCDCQNIVNNIKNGSAAFIIPHTPEVEKAVDLQARWILIFTAIGDKTSYFRDEYEFEVYAK